MNKQELLSQLENAKNNYILTLASCSLFSNEKAYPILEESVCEFGRFNINFKQVADMMKKEGDRNTACNEFVKGGMRNFIKETFELINGYCKETNQDFSQWKNHLFAKTLRNTLSHNFKIKIKDPKELCKLPLSWNGRTITPEMNNSFLDLSFFGYAEAWELYTEMKSFVETELH